MSLAVILLNLRPLRVPKKRGCEHRSLMPLAEGMPWQTGRGPGQSPEMMDAIRFTSYHHILVYIRSTTCCSRSRDEMGFTFSKTATLLCLLVIVHAIEFQDEQSQSVRCTPSDLESWDLTEGIHTNSTSNFVFETVNSLLQHWSNTRYRNGKVSFTSHFSVTRTHGF